MDKKELLKRWALAYTEPSLFYIPWRKRKSYIKYRVKIYFKIKTGVDSEGNPIYSNLSNTQKYKTIMGVFDPDGNLIYCSAYRRNGNVINNYAHTIWLYNLTPGKYTIQCLQYGIGVGIGSSGNIMTFTVPAIINQSQITNNNSSALSPTLEFYYYFNYAGLIFSADVTLCDLGDITIGTDLFDTFTETVEPPGYGECKSAYEAAAKSIGLEDWKFTNEKYMQTIINQIGDNEYVTIPRAYECDGPIYYSYPTLHVVYTDGITEEEITSINFAGYISDSSEYWLTCLNNNLEYDMETQVKYTPTFDNQSYRWVGTALSGTSGAFTNYYADDVSNLIFSNPDVRGSIGGYIAGVGSIGTGGASASPLRYKNCTVKDVSLSIGSTSGKMAVYDTDGSAKDYYYGKPYLSINWNIEGKKRKWSSYDDYYDASTETASSVSALISQKISHAQASASRVAQKYKANNDFDTISFNGQISQYPLAALFGDIPAGKTLARHYNKPPSSGKQLEVVVDESRKIVGIKWNRPWGQTTDNREDRYLRPMLDQYLADLSEYDNDGAYKNTKMWIPIYDGYGTSKYIFMRQNIVEVNTGVIPNR